MILNVKLTIGDNISRDAIKFWNYVSIKNEISIEFLLRYTSKIISRRTARKNLKISHRKNVFKRKKNNFNSDITSVASDGLAFDSICVSKCRVRYKKGLEYNIHHYKK